MVAIMMKKIRASRGSFTVEASIAMVSLIFFILFLMSYIGGLYTESLIEECLLETSQVVRAKLPVITSIEKLTIVEEPLFRSLVKNEFKNAFEKRTTQRDVFKFGIKELNIDSSDSQYISDCSDKMKFSVGVRWQIIFLESTEIEIQRVLYCQRLPEFFHVELPTAGEETQAKVVYLTNYESVYHTDPNCYHLSKSKRPVDFESLNDKKRECNNCIKRRMHEPQ